MTTQTRAALERAINAYNSVWNVAKDIDAHNVDEIREAAMKAALAQEAAGDGVKESDGGALVPIYCKPWRTIVFVKEKHKAELLEKNGGPSEPAPAVADEPFVEATDVESDYERGWREGRADLQHLVDGALARVLASEAPAVVAEPEAWDHRVFCACESCTDNDPEAAVHVREDIGVMPDGTWLCADCYRECDNREYGMSPNDLDDFEYPSFADLPRPQSAKPASQALPGREAREVERLKALSDLSIRRMAEMAEPGFIGAFGARDIAVARALAAESRLATIEAEVRVDQRERDAVICDGLSAKIMTEADHVHEQDDWDAYEHLECVATAYGSAAAAIRSGKGERS